MPAKRRLHRRDDSADNLHGYPPRPPVQCPGPCKRVAEPFAGDYCWCCAQSLSLAADAVPLPRNAGRVSAGRKPAAGKVRDKSISPVYTAVKTGGR